MTVLASLYDWLMLVHTLAAMVWLGGTLVLSLLATNVTRAAAGDDVARFVRGLRVVGPATLAPATLLVVGMGVWLILNSAAWSFSQFWVLLAVATWDMVFKPGL